MQTISVKAFANCGSLVSITIPDSVDGIDKDAFTNCPNLRFLNASEGSYAAKYFAAKFPNVQLNGSAYTVNFYSQNKPLTTGVYGAGDLIGAPQKPVREDYTFMGWFKNAACTMKWDFSKDIMPARTLVLYAGWEYTPAGFETRAVQNGLAITGYTGSMKNLVIPEKLEGKPVRALDADAISASIISVTLPATMQTVDANAFRQAAALTEILCDENSEYFLSENGVLYSADTMTLLNYPMSKNAEAFSVPFGVEEIQANAFHRNPYITRIVLPDGIRELGDGCFADCSRLADINLPDTLDTLGRGVFSYCPSLRTLRFESDPAAVSAATFANSAVSLKGPLDAVNLPAAVDIPTANGVIYGNYNMYSLLFYMDGELIAYYAMRAGETLGELPLNGNDFRVYDGWSLTPGGAAANLKQVYMPEENLSLYAVYHIPFTTRAVQGGVELVKYTGTAKEIQVPEVIDGNRVVSIAENCFAGISGLVLKGNKGSVTAAFAARKNLTFLPFTYTLRREANGGTPVADVTLAATDPLPADVPTREGYSFKGWYTDAELTKPAALTAMPAADLTLYAAWERSGSAVVNVPFTFKRVADGLSITGYTGGLGSVTLPSRINGELVTEIAEYAFFGSETLLEITLPSTLKRIGDYAFAESRIGKVTVGNGVTSIGAYAFNECFELSSITLGTGLTTIGEGAFAYCQALTSVKIPAKVTTLPTDAFHSCTALTEVTLPSALTTIESGAFAYCEGIRLITIPAKATSIADGAFAHCSSLESIRVASSNTAYKAVNNVLFSRDGSELCLYPAGKTTESYTLPVDVRAIRDEALVGARLSSISLNAQLRSIGSRAFKDCELTSVNLDDAASLVSIGEYAFAGCTGLAEIILPDNELNIFDGAFTGCGNLLRVVIPQNVSHIGDNAVPRNRELVIETFADTVGEAYAKANGISYILLTDKVTIQETLLTVTELPRRIPVKPQDAVLTWQTANAAVATVKNGLVTPVGAGTVTITAYADHEVVGTCQVTVEQRVQLTMPEQLVAIADEAFAGGGVFNAIVCGSQLQSIGARAFADNAQLILLQLPDTMTSIAEDAFAGCPNVVVKCSPDSQTAVLLREIGLDVLAD